MNEEILIFEKIINNNDISIKSITITKDIDYVNIKIIYKNNQITKIYVPYFKK